MSSLPRGPKALLSSTATANSICLLIHLHLNNVWLRFHQHQALLVPGTCPRVPGPSSPSRTRLVADWLGWYQMVPFGSLTAAEHRSGTAPRIVVGIRGVSSCVNPAQALDEQVPAQRDSYRNLQRPHGVDSVRECAE